VSQRLRHPFFTRLTPYGILIVAIIQLEADQVNCTKEVLLLFAQPDSGAILMIFFKGK
jgi:hypothetical protein